MALTIILSFMNASIGNFIKRLLRWSSYITRMQKGLIFEREKWEDFDGKAVNSNVKALVRKCAELCEAYGILSEGQTVKLTDDSYGTYDEWLAGNSG